MSRRPALSIVPREPEPAAGHGEPPGPPGPPRTRLPVWLVVLRGPQIGRRFELLPGRTTMGCSAQCTLRIDGDEVANAHAAIDYDGDALGLEALGDEGVTCVNDARVRRAPLQHGDTLTLGRVCLRVVKHETPEAAYHEELYTIATTDALTNLANKRFFCALLDKGVAEARQHKQPLALIKCDLDHFRRCNELAGHSGGDSVLSQVAAVLRGQVREGEVVARFGGEEFVVLLPETELAEAERIAEQIRCRIQEAELSVEGRRFPQTLSLGVAALRETDAGGDELLERVDTMLMSAKRGGRNRVASERAASIG